MAKLNFLLQGLDEKNDHYDAVEKLLVLPNINYCLVSVAFLNKVGAELLAKELANCSNKLKFYIGIRNGVTSKQGIETLINNGVYPICVDTATDAFIFHPKVYLAQNDQSAKIIVGSANFTSGGLINNIESSLLLDMDLSDINDKALVDSITKQFSNLEARHTENIFALNCGYDLDEMVKEGLLIDESTTTFITKNKSSKATRENNRTRMKIKTRKIASTKKSKVQTNEPILIPNTTKSISAIIDNALLWKSGPLTRRDLNIPDGKNTNRTGSMLFKVGDPSQNIDQRHYFREVVFKDADWKFGTKATNLHKEFCNVKFRIIIRGIDYGIHMLELSHDTRTDTATYLQNNGVTNIRWGSVVKLLIAQEDLLGDILCIYAPDIDSDIFTLTFDEN